MGMKGEAKKTKRDKKGKKAGISGFLPFLSLFVFFASISPFFTRLALGALSASSFFVELPRLRRIAPPPG
jgi:hypothetical protein